MEIKILGPGCARRRQAEDVVRAAVAASGAHARVVKVSGMMAIATRGVMKTPAAVVDGRVACSGKAPTTAEVLD